MTSSIVTESGGGSGPVAFLADLVGAPEAAFRILLTILLGYPLAALYRQHVQTLNKGLQHFFFAATGFALCAFNYGFDVYHSAIAIWMTYLFARIFYRSPAKLAVINFVFHMAYLLIGYVYTESDDYDIKWTMPHCVLVLRLIGFGFDVADGQKPSEEMSKDQKETALTVIPSVLELSAFAYFPAAFLVGPQFPFTRYQKFINGDFRQYTGSTRAGLIRGGVGLVYLIVRQIGAIYLPDNYFVSAEYAEATFWTRMLHLGIWGRISLYKYISCWLMAEGALMCFGFTYAGKTADNEPDWSGCSNVKLILFETGSKMTHYVQSFNVNTNHWVAQYVYKRLKFLNNRTLSYAGALIFLAVWHGFHSGYYMAFFLEYSIVTFEKQLDIAYKEAIQPKFGHIIENTLIGRVTLFVMCKIYNVLFMGWCLLPFTLLSYERWWVGFVASNQFGFILLAVCLVLHLVYQNVLAKKFRKPKGVEARTKTD